MRTLLATPGTAAWLAGEQDDPEIGLIVARAVGEEVEVLTAGTGVGFRRRGIGRALLEAATVWALSAGARRIVLEVAVDNTAARALYDRAGFRPCGRRPDYYSGEPRRDALLLELTLE